MAKKSNMDLKNKTIYSIYVRNHSPEGTFAGVVKDLPRIKDLGVEILWLLPIHPIGFQNKKGKLGCPYSIWDFRDINSEYGTLEDFKEMIYKVHQIDMKMMIDVVFNHTSHDSVLWRMHPEFFYRDQRGMPINKCGDWSDIIDLDYTNLDLWEHQLDTLKYWANLGLDGYRCDVASFVPIEFWERARDEIGNINPDFIWLAETVHTSFLYEYRKQGFLAHSDAEMYQAFDITYDYDTHGYFMDYLNGKGSLKNLLYHKTLQEVIYPQNYMKLRFLENHDQKRSFDLFPNKERLINWLSFTFFENGVPLLYAGQETLNTFTPSLFNKEDVQWKIEDLDYYNFIKRLIALRKDPIFKEGLFQMIGEGKADVVECLYTMKDQNKIIRNVLGVFNLGNQEGEKKLEGFKILNKKKIGAVNKTYTNQLNNTCIQVKGGKIRLKDCPLVIEI
jgi:glycosidase